MNKRDLLLDNVDILDIGEVFNTEPNPEWIWVNRLVFSDIIYSIRGNQEIEDFDINVIDEQQMFNVLDKILAKHQYTKINQHIFATWEQEYKPTKDIETIIFVRDDVYRKICIDIQNRFDWFLKAMAIDTYCKVNSEFNNINHCFEEMYEDNYRIIEDILSLKHHYYITGKWEYVPKENVLIFTKDGQLMNRWSEQEANSFYKEKLL